MSNKTIRVTMTGPEAVVLPTLEAFARYHGWADGGPVSQEDVARGALFDFIKRSVTAYNVAQAQAQAGTAAAAAVESVVPLTTLELVIE
jgi:hypothetical protein